MKPSYTGIAGPIFRIPDMVGARSTAQPRTAMFLGAVTVMLPAANDFYDRGCRVWRLSSGWRLRLTPALAGLPPLERWPAHWWRTDPLADRPVWAACGYPRAPG